MKKILSTFISLIITTGLFAQNQGLQVMRYQTIIYDANNNPLPGTKVGIQISILQGSANGASVYTETQSPTTDARGVADILIGNGNVIAGDFGSIDWANGPYFIQTATNTPPQPIFSNSGTLTTVTGEMPQSISHNLPSNPSDHSHSNKKGHYIGELYGGGVVFYVNTDSGKVEHGLIASLADLSTACVWSNVTLTLIGPDAESTTNGKANTKAIIEQEGHKRSAALLCDTSTIGGYTDWYLPSMQELNVLWNNLYIINKALTGSGNQGTPLEQAAYWSSTEDETTTFAWYWGMYNAGPDGDTGGTSDKGELHYVRAIRAF